MRSEERAAGQAWAALFDPEDARSLAAAVDAWVDDLDAGGERLAAMRRAAAESAATLLGPAELVSAWSEVYADVVAAGPPEAPDAGWWEGKLRSSFEAAWDAEIRARGPGEPGF